MTIRSNVENWKRLQEEGYFEKHPCYQGIKDFGGEECIAAIERFVPLDAGMKVAIIGCGFGRESLKLAPLVDHIYGIDVNDLIIDKATAFLTENNVSNFTGVVFDEYKRAIPDNIDLVFSIVVMQHLTRDLVRDYFDVLGKKLRPGGHIVIQFLEVMIDGLDALDAPLIDQEPSISWTVRQIAELASTSNVKFQQVHSILVAPTVLWHWAHLTAPN